MHKHTYMYISQGASTNFDGSFYQLFAVNFIKPSTGVQWQLKFLLCIKVDSQAFTMLFRHINKFV